MPPKKRARVASPVLGSDIDYVERTASGRPARRSAGRTSLPAGYVPTDAALEQQGDDQLPSDSGFEDSEDEVMQARTPKKRKRVSPSPSLSSDAGDDVEPLPIDDISNDSDEVEDLKDSRPAEMALPEISLTFNAPAGMHWTLHHLQEMLILLGHTGPFVVRLDLNSLSRCCRATSAFQYCDLLFWTNQATPESAMKASTSTPTKKQSSKKRTAPAVASSSMTERAGFLDLPPEIRNDIYRLVLVQEEFVDFPLGGPTDRPNLSAALLATCRQISEEAAQILYGDNKFVLRRDFRERGKLHENPWSEIGWKDNYAFLSRMGPHNVANIRNLKLGLRDGTHIKNDWDDLHRCVNDKVSSEMRACPHPCLPRAAFESC